MQLLIDLFRYWADVVVTGDVTNVWLYDLPWEMQPYFVEMGHAIAAMFGW